MIGPHQSTVAAVAEAQEATGASGAQSSSSSDPMASIPIDASGSNDRNDRIIEEEEERRRTGRVFTKRTSKRLRKSPVSHQQAEPSSITTIPTNVDLDNGGERQSTTPKRAPRHRALWTQADQEIFSEAIAEHGRDFDKIQIFMKQKLKKRLSSDKVKNRDQVRHMYYRTWNKVCKLIEETAGKEALPHEVADESVKKVRREKDDVKKGTREEIKAILAYLVLKKKLRKDDPKFGVRFTQLKNRGSTLFKVKGKKVKVKLPICKALKKDDEEGHVSGGSAVLSPSLPKKITLQLLPQTNEDFIAVQLSACNPRVKMVLTPSQSIASVISYMHSKWAPSRHPGNVEGPGSPSLCFLPPSSSSASPDDEDEAEGECLEWTLDTSRDVTVGKIYQTMSKPSKFVLHYSWTRKNQSVAMTTTTEGSSSSSSSSSFCALSHLCHLITASKEKEKAKCVSKSPKILSPLNSTSSASTSVTFAVPSAVSSCGGNVNKRRGSGVTMPPAKKPDLSSGITLMTPSGTVRKVLYSGRDGIQSVPVPMNHLMLAMKGPLPPPPPPPPPTRQQKSLLPKLTPSFTVPVLPSPKSRLLAPKTLPLPPPSSLPLATTTGASLIQLALKASNIKTSTSSPQKSPDPEPQPSTPPPPPPSSSAQMTLEQLLETPKKDGENQRKNDDDDDDDDDDDSPNVLDDDALRGPLPSEDTLFGFATSSNGFGGEATAEPTNFLKAFSAIPFGEGRKESSPIKSDIGDDLSWLPEVETSLPTGFLGQLESSPLKMRHLSQDSTSSSDGKESVVLSRHMADVDLTLRCMMEENSVDFVNKFHDLAAQIADPAGSSSSSTRKIIN